MKNDNDAEVSKYRGNGKQITFLTKLVTVDRCFLLKHMDHGKIR